MTHLRLEVETLAAPWSGAEAVAWARTLGGGAVVRLPQLVALVRDRLRLIDATADAESLVRQVFGPTVRPLETLVSTARRLLSPGPGGVVLTAHGEPTHEAILRWRWLTLRVPAALMICAAWPARAAEPPARVTLLDRTLAPQGPVAHLHVHQGNMADFERVWTTLARYGLPAELHHAGAGAPPGWSPEGWMRCLAGALAARRLLFAAFNHRGGWPSVPATVVRVWPERRWHGPARQVLAALRGLDAVALTPDEINGLLTSTPDGPPPRAEHRNGPAPHPMLSGDCADERRLLAGLIVRLSGAPGDRTDAVPWRALLLTYLRVKGTLFTYLTHDPLAPGLSAFTQTYDRFKPYARWLSRHGADAVHLTVAEAPALNLRAQELREGPPRNAHELQGAWRAAGRWTRTHRVETTLTFHLIRNLRSERGWIAQREALDRSLAPLRHSLAEWPQQLLLRVRGLDLACDEKKGPLWLAAPLLRQMRTLSDRLSLRHRVPTLGLTLHVGEDWDHLVSGLRAVDEPLVWGLLRPGERVGHAFALGLDLAVWLAEHPVKTMPLQVRLLDLAWMLRAAQRLTTPAVGLRARAWEAEAHHLLRAHLGLNAEACSVQALIDLWADTLHDGAWQDWAFDPDRSVSPGLEGRFVRWLRGTSRPGAGALDQPISVPAADDVAALLEIRRDLLERLAERRITVEVNPTSNMLVGARGRPLDQPMFRLHPLQPGTGPDVDPVVAVCLNADDPLAFATSLSDEFAYAWAGLRSAGVTPGVAADWLERAATASWRARFGAPSTDEPTARPAG